MIAGGSADEGAGDEGAGVAFDFQAILIVGCGNAGLRIGANAIIVRHVG